MDSHVLISMKISSDRQTDMAMIISTILHFHCKWTKKKTSESLTCVSVIKSVPPRKSLIPHSHFGIFIDIHLLKKTKSLDGQVDFASSQCILHTTFCKPISGRETNTYVGTFIVLIRFGPLGLIHEPKIQTIVERAWFWNTWGHLEQCYNHSQKMFRKLFPAVFSNT